MIDKSCTESDWKIKFRIRNDENMLSAMILTRRENDSTDQRGKLKFLDENDF